MIAILFETYGEAALFEEKDLKHAVYNLTTYHIGELLPDHLVYYVVQMQEKGAFFEEFWKWVHDYLFSTEHIPPGAQPHLRWCLDVLSG